MPANAFSVFAAICADISLHRLPVRKPREPELTFLAIRKIWSRLGRYAIENRAALTRILKKVRAFICITSF